MRKVNFLRKKHPRFIYKGYFYRIIDSNLKVVFDFQIEPDIRFKPEIIIKNISKLRLKKVGDRVLNNLIFHLGLVEIPSYWKTTCSPKIIIRAGYLNEEQIRWWKDLIINGMGQFFYENKIDWRPSNFLRIKCEKPITEANLTKNFLTNFKKRYLVPIGGGRDSLVTLESLKKQKKKIGCFMVNPTESAKKVVKIANIKDKVIVKRKIDKTLIDLNKKGYLNGHTPFTAVLSFLSVFCAVLFDYKNIAFSNEKSADQGNLKYLGKIINHQYSKTSQFEKKFKNYSKKYLAKNVNYFSFLRPYTELKISKIFTKYPKYFSAFSSCNIAPTLSRTLDEIGASKKGTAFSKWCGKCPKCLFVYATLYPFLEKKELLEIFGEDLFEKKELLPIMKALIGQLKHKPFECVGTYKESKMVFNLSLKKAKKSGEISYLLQKFNDIK